MGLTPLLIKLYRDMADLTWQDCAARCRTRFSCCSPEYCGMAQEIAGGTIVPTGHPTLPFMGPNGCTVEPHFRPLCTLHHCDINSLGFHKTDPVWTEKYFKPREAIEEEELVVGRF